MRTVIEIAQGVRIGQLKAVDILSTVRSAVETHNPTLNAFWVLDWRGAMRAAEEVDARVRIGEDPGPLAGVPFGVKDVQDCAGFPTSHGCAFFKDSPPKTKDETIIARLRAAGAIPIGKTATAEFGLDYATRTKAWGVTGNPWDPARTPGGSSGGSAAAVAAGMVPFATGGDSGGSIRLPAAYTGTVGLKPNHGRIGRSHGGDFGTHAVITTTVGDTARLLDVVAGPADADKASLERPRVRYEETIETLPTRGVRALWNADLGGHVYCEPEVVQIARRAADALAAAAGVAIVEGAFPLSANPVRVLRVFTSLSALSIALRNDLWTPEKKRGLSDPMREYVENGESRTADEYVDALIARSRLEAEIAAIFADFDLVMSPTTTYTAFPAAGPVPTVVDGHQVDRDSGSLTLNNLTGWANLTQRPAISIPAGLSEQGLPVGLQITSRHHREDLLLRLARILEQTRPWPRTAPRPSAV